MDPVVSHAAQMFPDPQGLSNESLQDRITELAACITIATAQLLALVAELDRREAWSDWGVKSCAHWLNWKCGIGIGAAREKVRVARALETLPAIRAAFTAGEVSYSKVRAMTRVATAETEETLLMVARHGTASHVEDLVRNYRRVLRNEAVATSNDVHAARELCWCWDEDGSLVIRARLPAESGALVLQALAAAEDGISATAFAENVPAETRGDESPAAALRADALADIAGQYLSDKSNPARQAERYQVVVHVDEECLRDVGDSARCDIADGPALCPETARRIACDASVVVLRSGADGSALNITRKSRSVPPAIRRALAHRDHGCRFPGCTSVRHVDAHHIRHWGDGGETSVANLVLLCRHHHRLVHEGGFRVSRGDGGGLQFFTPHDVVIPAVPTSATVTGDIATVAREFVADVSAETLVPAWQGERMDMGLAVAGLIGAAAG